MQARNYNSKNEHSCRPETPLHDVPDKAEVSAFTVGFFLGTISTVRLRSFLNSGVITRSVLGTGAFPVFLLGEAVAPELEDGAADAED